MSADDFFKNAGLNVTLRELFKISLRKYGKYCVRFKSRRTDPLYLI